MDCYTYERNFGCRITDDLVYRGLRVLVMENELLRIGILVDKGTDIFEFLHKPTDTDFLWRSPLGIKNPATHVPTVARSDGNYLEYYEGGWQECLPNGGPPFEISGAEEGLHGEVWGIPWKYAVLEDTPERISVKFSVRTYRTPFYLEKTLTLASGKAVLEIQESLLNEGREDLELMWGHHPAFGPPFIDETCVVDAPAGKVLIHEPQFDPTSILPAGKTFEWPDATDGKGNRVDLRHIAPMSAKRAELAYLMDFKEPWYAVTNTGKEVGFALRWSEPLKYVWFWQVFGGSFGHPWYGRTYNIALEPWSSYPSTGLGEAIKNGSQLRMKAGQTLTLKLLAVAYSGIKGVRSVDADGGVTGE